MAGGLLKIGGWSTGSTTASERSCSTDARSRLASLNPYHWAAMKHQIPSTYSKSQNESQTNRPNENSFKNKSLKPNGFNHKKGQPNKPQQHTGQTTKGQHKQFQQKQISRGRGMVEEGKEYGGERKKERARNCKASMRKH